MMPSPTTQPSPDPPPRKRILVIEDEVIVGMDIAAQLESLGYEVAGMAATSEDAFQLARDHRPDLVLTDIQLQGKMEGTECAIRLHSEFHLPIVFLTAYTEDTIIDQVRQAEPFGFILKPFEIRELKAVIRMALDRAESQAQKQKILENLRQSEENYRKLFEELSRQQDRLEEIVRERTAELTRSNAELRNLWRAIENSPSSVVITDHQGKIEYVNPRFCELSGYSLEEAIGEYPRVLKSGVHPPEFYIDLWKCIAAGNTWRGEICNRTKSGNHYWEQVSISPVRDEYGIITHFVAIKEDITDKQKVAEELRAAKETAESANRAKSLFLANMSHEIRTPMNAILGFSQLLRQDPATTADQNHYLDIINRSGEHLLSLLNDILEMSKIEAGSVQLNFKAFNIHAMVHDLELMFRPRAEAKNLRFITHLDNGAPTHVTGDEGKVRQILINLLGNAVKFTEKGYIVFRIQTEPQGSTSVKLIFHIEDTGPGIKGEEAGLLFRSFEQTDAGRRSATGTGLGLAISRQFARLMRGDVVVESGSGAGAVFRVELPFEIAPGDPTPAAGFELPLLDLKPNQKKPKILVVDDSSDTRLLLTQVLTASGFEIADAIDGAQGLAQFESWQPDLILTDMRMPELDGFEMTRRIRATGSKVRIVSLTAGAFEEDRQKALGAGVDAFLGKPFRTLQVFDVISHLLRIEYRTSHAKPQPSRTETGDRTNPEQLDLSVLPQKLIIEMRQAINRADLDQLLDLINQTAASNPDIARTLSQLASSYNYRVLSKLLGIEGQ